MRGGQQGVLEYQTLREISFTTNSIEGRDIGGVGVVNRASRSNESLYAGTRREASTNISVGRDSNDIGRYGFQMRSKAESRDGTRIEYCISRISSNSYSVGSSWRWVGSSEI